jgi:non-specific serine/threonine protein kinase/serine/threonine-protein kinase
VSDVYSLGVVLYELLTDRSPYRPRSRAPRDLAEAICTTEPVRPSAAVSEADASLGRRLRGDLDTILLTALRKEPERRYPSVEQLAGDVRRHLEGLPVRARPDTFGYRAGKFVRRNRAGVAAAVLVALALIAGTVATAWQARQARAAQARAEHRFNDVRALAHAVLFDYHDAIKDLPGSTPVRERLVRDALSYLDTLAREAQGDRSLQRELAAAYERVADVQGGNLSGNLGDSQGALASYAKAQQILEALFAADSGDGQTRRALARTAVARGTLLFDSGDVEGSLALARQAEAVLRPLADDSVDAHLRLALAAADDLLGVLLLETGDARGAAERHRIAIRRLEAAPPAEQAVPAFRRALSVAHQHLGDDLIQLDDREATLESYRRSRAIRVALVAEFPDNGDYKGLVGTIDFWTGTVLAELGRYEEALAKYRLGLAGDSAQFVRDPKNALARAALGFTLSRVAEMLLRLGKPGEALAAFQQSRTIRAAELRQDSTNLFKRFQLIEAQAGVCRATVPTAPARADQECERAAELMRGTTLEPSNAGYRGFLAGQLTDLAEAYDSLGRRGGAEERRRRHLAALDLYRRSSAIWSDLDARGLVNPTDTGRVTAARQAVARAEAGGR